METIVLVTHGLLAVVIVALVLLQQGRGSDVGAAFGSGSSNTFFGSSGGGNVLSRSTALLAGLFFATSLSLAFFARQESERALRVDLPAGFSQPAQSATEEDSPSALLPENDFPEPPATGDFPEPPE